MDSPILDFMSTFMKPSLPPVPLRTRLIAMSTKK